MLKLWKFSPLCRQNQSLTWLGAVFYNGHFTWLDNSYVNYLNWAPGQPDVHEWGECINNNNNDNNNNNNNNNNDNNNALWVVQVIDRVAACCGARVVGHLGFKDIPGRGMLDREIGSTTWDMNLLPVEEEIQGDAGHSLDFHHPWLTEQNQSPGSCLTPSSLGNQSLEQSSWDVQPVDFVAIS